MDVSLLFLHLSEVRGNSRVAGYENWIELLGARLGQANVSQLHAASFGSSSPPRGLHVSMRENAAYSAKMHQLVFSGSLIPDGELHYWKRRGGKVTIEVYRFKSLRVDSLLDISKDEGRRAHMEVSFTFGTVTAQSM